MIWLQLWCPSHQCPGPLQITGSSHHPCSCHQVLVCPVHDQGKEMLVMWDSAVRPQELGKPGTNVGGGWGVEISGRNRSYRGCKNDWILWKGLYRVITFVAGSGVRDQRSHNSWANVFCSSSTENDTSYTPKRRCVLKFLRETQSSVPSCRSACSSPVDLSCSYSPVGSAVQLHM